MLKENERLDCLIKEGYEIIQNDDVFFFFNRCTVIRTFD